MRWNVGILGTIALLTSAPASFAQATLPPGAHVPMAPFRIGDGLYYVGSSFYAVYLFVTKAGLIVLDGGDAAVGQQALANIRALGYDPKNIKIILNTHDHFDHAGGLAEIKRAAAKDAIFYASPKEAVVLAAGGKGDPIVKDDPLYYYEPVKPNAILRDGQQVTLGGWTLTAHFTPGHTAGCTSWSFPVTVAGKVRHGLAPCSWALLPGVALGKTETWPGITADYKHSFATWKSLPCDVFISSSHQFFNFKQKKAALDAGNPEAFIDPDGCRQFFVDAEAKFRAELKKQNP